MLKQQAKASKQATNQAVRNILLVCVFFSFCFLFIFCEYVPFTCPSLFVDSSALMDIVVRLYLSMTYDFALVFVDPYKVKTEMFCTQETKFVMKWEEKKMALERNKERKRTLYSLFICEIFKNYIHRAKVQQYSHCRWSFVWHQ